MTSQSSREIMDKGTTLTEYIAGIYTRMGPPNRNYFHIGNHQAIPHTIKKRECLSKMNHPSLGNYINVFRILSMRYSRSCRGITSHKTLLWSPRPENQIISEMREGPILAQITLYPNASTSPQKNKRKTKQKDERRPGPRCPATLRIQRWSWS